MMVFPYETEAANGLMDYHWWINAHFIFSRQCIEDYVQDQRIEIRLSKRRDK